MRLDGNGNQVLDDVRELVRNGERLSLSPGNLLRRRAVQRFRTKSRLVEQLGIEGTNRRRGGLDAGGIDRRRGRRIETRLDQRGPGQHQQLRVVLGFDFRVRHARQELDPAVHDDASHVAGGAREEHAICRPGAAERRSIALPILFLVGRFRLGQQQAAVGEYPLRQQAGVERLRLGARQGRERLRVLEGESERQRRLPLPGGKRDAVGIVGGIGADPEVIERPAGRGRAGAQRQLRLVLPDACNGAETLVRVIGIEIEDGLQQDERHTVEANGIVAKPGPGEAWVLAAAKAIPGRAIGVGVGKIRVNRPIPVANFRRPVRHRLPVHPRQHLRPGVVRQWPDEA